MEFVSPPQWQGEDPVARVAGFEFELTNIELEPCCQLVQQQFGGTIEQVQSLEARIRDTEVGDFKVELDTAFVKRITSWLERKDATIDKNEDIQTAKRKLSQLIGDAASQVIPLEIVTPPLPQAHFAKLEALVSHLRQQNVKGTRDSFFYAFGLQINPEMPSEKLADNYAIFRAFLVLYPWLKKQIRIDPSRRMLSFIDPFPEAYVRQLMQQPQPESWEHFMKDYIYNNPTRNRALDMLPMFAHRDDQILSALPADIRAQVKARPAFHYRMPNCDIDNPEWSLAYEWYLWVTVERLARDTSHLNRLAEDFFQYMHEPFHSLSDGWAKRLDDEVSQLG